MIHLLKENILFDCKADNAEMVIRTISARLEKNGYIESPYVEAVLEREKEYPTGLPTEDVFVAIPHANCPAVKRTCIGVAKMKQPVDFCNAVDPESTLPAELVFLLASTSGAEAHLEELQELMGCFSRVGFLNDLKNAKDEDEFIRIFANLDLYEEA